VVTFSAHGTNREILLQAAKKFKAIYNLECPLVTKIYKEIDMYIKKGISTFFYIAQPHHQEAKNVMGYMQSLGVKYYVFQHSHEIPLIDPSVPFTVLSQTTLNYAHVKQVCEDIAKSYPDATFPPLTDICKATYDRQTVIIQNIDKFDTLIVIGGKESHNTKELYQL
jgi:4-hydroxy-3-methylbut-2-enyl diphosphate reductase